MDELTLAILITVGISAFFRYLKALKTKNCENLKTNTEDTYEVNSMSKKMSIAQKMFNEGREKEALAIAALSTCIDNESRKQAAKLFAAEFDFLN